MMTRRATDAARIHPDGLRIMDRAVQIGSAGQATRVTLGCNLQGYAA
jgi:hypothetical protein